MDPGRTCMEILFTLVCDTHTQIHNEELFVSILLMSTSSAEIR